MEKAQLPIELQVMKKYQSEETEIQTTNERFCWLCFISENPHAIILYGSGTKEEINFIAMQLIGPNLASLRKKSPSEPKRFSVGTTLLLGYACLEAIRDLHNVNVIHRDIKPVNIWKWQIFLFQIFVILVEFRNGNTRISTEKHSIHTGLWISTLSYGR